MYNKLLSQAAEEDIEVIEVAFKGRIKGLYCNKVIALNKNIETTAERACILAEELGHYHTSVGNILDQKLIRNRKLECKARAWAYENLVPLDKFIRAFNEGVQTRHEMAEYLDVTEQFLCEAMKYYKEKYGPYCKVGDYYICFEPLVIIQDLQNELNKS